jgi:hypothetical protein
MGEESEGFRVVREVGELREALESKLKTSCSKN